MDPSSAPDTPKSRRQQQKPVCGPVLPPDHSIAHKDSLARSKAEEETPDNSTEVFDYFEMKTALPKPRDRLSLPSTASAGLLESRWGQKSSPQANSPLTSTNFWQYKESTRAHVSPNTSVPPAESSDIYPTPPKSFVVKSTRWSTGSINSMSTVPRSVQKFAGRYCGVTRPFIDSHCHIDFLFDRSGFKGSYAKYRQVNEETFVPNYRGCVAVFCDPRKFTPNGGFWKDVLAEDNVWGAIGCHPKCATDFGPRQEAALRAMVRHPKVKAVGEIGLDYSGSFSRHKDVQKRVLVRQCEIALEMKLPIVIHSRDSEHEIMEVLEEVLPKNYKIHRHCFTGTWVEAEEWLRRFPNSYIGLTPLVTWKGQDRAYGPRDVAKRLPLNKLLLETDAPYFLPRCIYRNDMKFSHPGFAITVAEEVAWLKHCSVDEVLQQVLHNTCNMYDLEL